MLNNYSFQGLGKQPSQYGTHENRSLDQWHQVKRGTVAGTCIPSAGSADGRTPGAGWPHRALGSKALLQKNRKLAGVVAHSFSLDTHSGGRVLPDI